MVSKKKGLASQTNRHTHRQTDRQTLLALPPADCVKCSNSQHSIVVTQRKAVGNSSEQLNDASKIGSSYYSDYFCILACDVLHRVWWDSSVERHRHVPIDVVMNTRHREGPSSSTIRSLAPR